MQITPEYGERSLLADFQSSSGARKAAEELNGLGYGAVQVGRISSYPTETLTGMTLFAEDSEIGLSVDTWNDNDPDPYVNVHDDTDSINGGKAFLVVAVKDYESYTLATKILKKHGGRL